MDIAQVSELLLRHQIQIGRKCLTSWAKFWDKTAEIRAQWPGRASHQCGVGSIPVRCHMCAEFVAGSHLATRVFLRVLRFSSLHKNQHFKFQFDQDKGPACKPAKVDVASLSKYCNLLLSKKRGGKVIMRCVIL